MKASAALFIAVASRKNGREFGDLGWWVRRLFVPADEWSRRDSFSFKSSSSGGGGQ